MSMLPPLLPPWSLFPTLPVLLVLYVVALHACLLAAVVKELTEVKEAWSARASSGETRSRGQKGGKGAKGPRAKVEKPTQAVHSTPRLSAEDAVRAQLQRIAQRRSALETRLRRHEEELQHRAREDLLHLGQGADGCVDSYVGSSVDNCVDNCVDNYVYHE